MTETAEQETNRIDQIARANLDLVYAAALRSMNGDPHRAADVTQAVMLVLLQKARDRKLPPEKFMSGWLINVTGYAAMQARRSAARRIRHEMNAAVTAAAESSPPQMLQTDIRHVLDESLLRLGKIDREVLVRRYLQGQSVNDISQALGMEANTASKRISRAMGKLRTILARRGITAPATLVAAVFTAEAAVKAPAALAIGGAASPAISSAVKHLSWKLAMIKLKYAAVACFLGIVLIGGGIVAVRSFHADATTPIDPGATGQKLPSPPEAQIVWPADPPTIDNVRIIDPPSDAILKELLTGLRSNQAKFHVIHVHAIGAARMYDQAGHAWGGTYFSKGQAWLEAGPNRRARTEVDRAQTMILQPSGGFGPPTDVSFVETWDGAITMREYRPPFSQPRGETFNTRDLSDGDGISGAKFSMQVPWDEETSADQHGSHKTIDRNPLDSGVLSKMSLSAERVQLTPGQAAMELTVTIPDPVIQRVETFWFDPQRGYALLARRNTTKFRNMDMSRQTYVIESLAEAGPGIFYPVKAQSIWTLQGNPLQWEIFVATEVVANEAFDAGHFHLTFTPGIDVYDYKNGVAGKPKPATKD